jgi:hypothetical protein
MVLPLWVEERVQLVAEAVCIVNLYIHARRFRRRQGVPLVLTEGRRPLQRHRSGHENRQYRSD